ncbi:MAG: thermonuclease family protein [Gammaproteobacteria bacterium]|nr:thermonuclease family protein [Gammaproteobacteria bacterium]
MHWTARVIALCFLVFLSLAASADTLTGKVIKITDGDTLYVLDANYEQHKIRLAGIDAPERKQAYGLASRKHPGGLRRYCGGWLLSVI